jgi:hypothetical protein
MTENLPDTTENESTEKPTRRDIVNAGDDDIVAGSGTDNIDMKEIEMVDEDSPLAQETGSTGPQKRQVDEEWLSDFLADQIYDKDSAFAREYLQNAETACIRAAKLAIKNHPDYGHEWLGRNYWVNADTGATLSECTERDRQTVLADFDIAAENLRKVTLPRDLSEVVEAAHSIGYDPTIEVTIYHDDREVHIEDNGIGMTTEEYDKAFNYTGRSGSKLESDTGGMFGAGALTFGNPAGKEGGMTVTSHSRRTDVADYKHQPIKAYTYLGGYNEMPSEDVPDDFYGSRFEVPVLPPEDGGIYMDSFHEWFRSYASMLRVPVLYREIEAGETTVKEEYGGVTITEKFMDEDDNEPAVVVHRPGEFTAISGPTVDNKVGKQNYSTRYADTWLVSMEIDRNTTTKISSLWNVGVQIHNEQELCVSGPHRAMLREDIESENPHDIFTPTPTGDRDRLQGENKDFWNHVSQEVDDELERYFAATLSEFFEQDPIDVVYQNRNKWDMFLEMISYKSMTTESRMIEKLNDSSELPDVKTSGPPDDRDAGDVEKTDDEKRIAKIQMMTKDKQYVPSSCRDPAKKKYRNETKLGNLLAQTPAENIYLAASTGGNFEDYLDVVKHTHDEWEVIVLGKARYSKYQSKFGFKKLTNVPLKQDDEHDFDVPSYTHEKYATSDDGTENTGKPDDIRERVLKIRTTSSSDVDREYSIGSLLTEWDDCDLNFSTELVLFRRGQNYENISDHYDLGKETAIASVSNPEYEELKESEHVMSFEEYKERALNTVFATEKGPRKLRDLFESVEDEFLMFTYSDDDKYRDLVHGANEPLADRLKEKARSSAIRSHNEDDRESVICWISGKQMGKSRYFLRREFNKVIGKMDMKAAIALRIGYGNDPVTFLYKTSISGRSLDKIELRAEMLNWDDDSDAYYRLRKTDSSYVEEFLEALHDIGVDPEVITEGEIYEAVTEQLQSDDFGLYGEMNDRSDQCGEGAAVDGTDDSDGSDEDKTLGDLFN